MRRRITKTLRELINFYYSDKGLDSNADKGFDLPVYHTTDMDSFYHILDDNCLSSNYCKHYEEELLYFFYGKAEYFPIKEQEDTYLIESPVTFGYSLQYLKSQKEIHRVLPFDSGGYYYERYSEKKLPAIVGFEIPSTYDDIKKYIDIFFKHKNSYIKSELNLDDKVLTRHPICLPMRTIKRMHREVNYSIRDVDYGDQAFTIEIQYFDTKFHLEFDVIFLPSHWYNSIEARKEIENDFPNVKFVYYECTSRFVATRKYEMMRREVRDYSRNYPISDSKHDLYRTR